MEYPVTPNKRVETNGVRKYSTSFQASEILLAHNVKLSSTMIKVTYNKPATGSFLNKSLPEPLWRSQPVANQGINMREHSCIDYVNVMNSNGIKSNEMKVKCVEEKLDDSIVATVKVKDPPKNLPVPDQKLMSHSTVHHENGHVDDLSNDNTNNYRKKVKEKNIVDDISKGTPETSAMVVSPTQGVTEVTRKQKDSSIGKEVEMKVNNNDGQIANTVRMFTRKRSDSLKVHVGKKTESAGENNSNRTVGTMKLVVSLYDIKGSKHKRQDSMMEDHGEETKIVEYSSRKDVTRDISVLKRKRSDSTRGNDGQESEAKRRKEESEAVVASGDVREVVYEDPTLPAGWYRHIHIRNPDSSTPKKVVCIVSPDGRRFYRRHVLRKYLKKFKLPFDADAFNFALYKSDSVPGKPTQVVPMYTDPTLPSGWWRQIRVRAGGVNAGRREVSIYSPDGKRHRSKVDLQRYVAQKRLDWNVEDFDFTVAGRPAQRVPEVKKAEAEDEESEEEEGEDEESEDESEEEEEDDEEEDLEVHDDLGAGTSDSETTDCEWLSREARWMQEVSGYLVNCGLTTVRAERRRRRASSDEHERTLRQALEAEQGLEGDEGDEGDEGEVPVGWVQRLARCRPDFLPLEDPAAAAVAAATQEFLKEMVLRAVHGWDGAEQGLLYDDVAELVNGCRGLRSLRSLVPRKITFRQFRHRNRQAHLKTFTH